MRIYPQLGLPAGGGQQFSIKTLGAFLYLANLGRRFPKEPLENSLRTAFLSVSLSGFLLITLYRSMISASLAVKIFHPPVQSLEEIPLSGYSLIISNGSSVHQMLINAEPGSDYHNLVKSNKLVPMKSEALGFDHIIKSTISFSIVSSGFQMFQF